MDTLFRRIRLKFIVIPLVVIISLLTSLDLFSYYYIRGMIIDRMSQDAKGTAVSVAYIIESDLGNYHEFIEDKITGTPYFDKILNIFTRLKDENKAIKYIYTVHRSGETTTEFALDADYIYDNYAPGTQLEFYPEEENTVTLETMNSGVATILPPTESDFGILIGACAPIFDNGTVIGAVGVDIDIQTVYDTVNNLLVLLVSIGLIIILFSLIVLVKSSNVLLYDILKDKLTKAYNKKYMNKILQDNIDNARRTKKNYSILMLDLDHFKAINDTYGHQFGDVVLSTVSKIIMDNIRKEDQFIRYGGEEFIVSVQNFDTDQAVLLAERIRTSVESYTIRDRSFEASLNVTISIGITSLNGRDLDPFKMIELADKALYKAKESRNTVEVCLE